MTLPLPYRTLQPDKVDGCRNWQGKYSKYTEAIPTRAFLTPLDEDEEVEVEISKGNITHIKYRAMGELQPNGTRSDFTSPLKDLKFVPMPALDVTLQCPALPFESPPSPLHLSPLLCLRL